MSRGYTFIVADSPTDWAELVAEWSRLARHSDRPCFSHDPLWISAIHSKLEDRRLSVCAVRFDSSLVGVVPFRRPTVTMTGPRVATGCTLDPSVDLCDVLMGKEHHQSRDAIDGAIRAIAAAQPFDVITFKRVPARGHLLASLQESAFRHSVTDDGASAYCSVQERSSLLSLSKEHLRNVERLHRKAERSRGAVSTASFVGLELTDEIFDRFVGIEGSGWKGEQGTGTALEIDTRSREFFREVARTMGSMGRARVDFLEIGGTPAAAQFAVRTEGIWYVLKIGFDPAFREFGPGAILLKWFLEAMCDDTEIGEVSITTSPAWAGRWHFNSEACVRVNVFGQTLRGAVLAAKAGVRSAARSVRDVLLNQQDQRLTD